MHSVKLVLNTTCKDSNFSMSSPLTLSCILILIFVGKACQFSLYYFWCREVKKRVVHVKAKLAKNGDVC